MRACREIALPLITFPAGAFYQVTDFKIELAFEAALFHRISGQFDNALR